MKKLTSMLFFLLALGACKKGDSVSTELSATEAVNLVATSLSGNSNGLIVVTADITVNAQSVFDLNIGCGNSKAYTVTHTSPAGSATAYSYVFAYNYTLNCNANNVPDNITGTSTDNGSFDGPRLSSTNTGASTFRVAGLTPTSLVYVINGEYKRSGSFTSKVENKTTGTTTVNIVVSNYTINKLTRIITSGTGTITITGTTSKGTTISFTSSLVYTGDGKATVTLNGTVYIVDLLTGEFVKK